VVLNPPAVSSGEKLMTTSNMFRERHRKNVRLALILAALVLFMFVTAIPFWRGLFNMFASGAL